MTKEQVIKNWLDSAEENRRTAADFFRSKHYDWCLFIWQLAIEKVLTDKKPNLEAYIKITKSL